MFQDVWNWWIWRTPRQIFSSSSSSFWLWTHSFEAQWVRSKRLFLCGFTGIWIEESSLQHAFSLLQDVLWRLLSSLCVCGCGGLWCIIFYFGRPKKGGLDRFLKLSPYIQTHFSLRLFKGIWRTWTLEGAKRSTPIAHFSPAHSFWLMSQYYSSSRLDFFILVFTLIQIFVFKLW